MEMLYNSTCQSIPELMNLDHDSSRILRITNSNQYFRKKKKKKRKLIQSLFNKFAHNEALFSPDFNRTTPRSLSCMAKISWRFSQR